MLPTYIQVYPTYLPTIYTSSNFFNNFISFFFSNHEFFTPRQYIGSRRRPSKVLALWAPSNYQYLKMTNYLLREVEPIPKKKIQNSTSQISRDIVSSGSYTEQFDPRLSLEQFSCITSTLNCFRMHRCSFSVRIIDSRI